MLLPGVCLILIVPLVLLPGIKFDTAFGPHTVDLMALLFNVQADRAIAPVVLLDSLHRSLVPKLLE